MKELNPPTDIQWPKLSRLDWLVLTIVSGGLCVLVVLMVTGCSASGELPAPSGMSERIKGWLEILNVGYHMTPEFSGCLMHQTGKCVIDFRFDLH